MDIDVVTPAIARDPFQQFFLHLDTHILAIFDFGIIDAYASHVHVVRIEYSMLHFTTLTLGCRKEQVSLGKAKPSELVCDKKKYDSVGILESGE